MNREHRENFKTSCKRYYQSKNSIEENEQVIRCQKGIGALPSHRVRTGSKSIRAPTSHGMKGAWSRSFRLRQLMVLCQILLRVHASNTLASLSEPVWNRGQFTTVSQIIFPSIWDTLACFLHWLKTFQKLRGIWKQLSPNGFQLTAFPSCFGSFLLWVMIKTCELAHDTPMRNAST